VKALGIGRISAYRALDQSVSTGAATDDGSRAEVDRLRRLQCKNESRPVTSQLAKPVPLHHCFIEGQKKKPR
jgi:hypothetical protein